jgi:hypothetical protein
VHNISTINYNLNMVKDTNGNLVTPSSDFIINHLISYGTCFALSSVAFAGASAYRLKMAGKKQDWPLIDVPPNLF